MTLEEAEYILSEVVIEEASVMSYNYISASEINEAINKILENKIKEEKKIKELEEIVLIQRKEIKTILNNKYKVKNRAPQIFKRLCVSKNIDKIKNNGINPVIA